MITHIILFTLLLGLLLFVGYRRVSKPALVRTLSGGLLALNGILVVLALALALLLWLDYPGVTQATPLIQEGETAQEGAQGQQQAQAGGSNFTALGAALATGLAAIGAGIAVGITGSAAIGAITEKPEAFGRTLIFVGLAEGIAIYGLIISFLILTGGFGEG
jgi:V/A-type H+-transporting ATPase subunit K